MMQIIAFGQVLHVTLSSNVRHASASAALGRCFGELSHNGRVRVEKVVARHAGFSGHAGRNGDDVGAVQRFGELF